MMRGTVVLSALVLLVLVLILSSVQAHHTSASTQSAKVVEKIMAKVGGGRVGWRVWGWGGGGGVGGGWGEMEGMGVGGGYLCICNVLFHALITHDHSLQ